MEQVATVTEDYEAEDESELTVLAGDVVVVKLAEGGSRMDSLYLVKEGLSIRLDHHADQALRSRRAYQNAGRTGNPRLDGGESVDHRRLLQHCRFEQVWNKTVRPAPKLALQGEWQPQGSGKLNSLT